MNITEKILQKVKYKKIIWNYRKYCTNKIGNALLYYKTEPFLLNKLPKRYLYLHPNNWNGLEIAKILNEFGYWVDIVDRRNTSFIPDPHKYDIFIGAGLAGPKYSDFAETLSPSTLKIFYATSANPKIRNEAIRKRIEYLYQRRKVNLGLRRIKKIDINKCMKYTDKIFCTGNHDYTITTYKEFGKEIFKINPTTDPSIGCNIKELDQKKNPRYFLFFSGHGLVHKGLDLLLEVFKEHKDIHLYVCAPLDEKDFIQEYREELYNTPNIHTIGFVSTNSRKFYELTSKCAYMILPSCAEGLATSVLTCMRRGLIPAVTRETGIDKELGAVYFESDTLEEIEKTIEELANKDSAFIFKRSNQAFIGSLDYTQEMFKYTFKKALLQSIKGFNQYRR